MSKLRVLLPALLLAGGVTFLAAGLLSCAPVPTGELTTMAPVGGEDILFGSEPTSPPPDETRRSFAPTHGADPTSQPTMSGALPSDTPAATLAPVEGAFATR